MHVKILDIDNPSSFWIKETPGCGMSEEAKVFQALHTEINSYFDDNISLPCIKRPEQGKVRDATLGYFKMYLRIIMHGPFYGNLSWPEFCSIQHLRANPHSFLVVL